MRALFKGCVILGCSYELAALGSRGKIPPLSALASRHKLLPLVILVPLAVHLWRYEPPAKATPPAFGARLTVD